MKPFGKDNILFCDNHVLVVNKPPEVTTQPDLCDLAKAWVKIEFNKPGRVFLEPIHRLDKPASGIVLFARTSKALSRLQEQMRERGMEKIYHAWVEGCPEKESGTLKHHLLHGSFRAEISSHGKEAVLDYEVIEQKNGNSYLRIRLHTGRYHQIRAQMAAIRCPILGDRKYGSVLPWKKGIALCATQLTFTHPVTRECVEVKSP
jgi:23S rRNA pseudouridine1911/1915/1917 synthase